MMEPVNRRRFLKRSAQAAAAAVVSGAGGPAHGVVGANERIRVACIGIHGRGFGHAKGFMGLKSKGVDVVALCDVDEMELGKKIDALTKIRGRKPGAHVDARKLLEDKSVDAISIATPNHWHSLMAIWGCQAGKDVYVEKPVSWCISEGRKTVQAARKYKRIVQVGQQHRSNPKFRTAAAKIRAGIIGEVYMTRSLVFRARESIGFKKRTTPPKHLHYDLWLGPAPKQPYHENLVHYKWHWFWDFGNGEIGNNGIHMLDLARMTIGKTTLPVKVSSMGGRFCYKDQAETPNTQIATWTYEDGTMMVCDVRNRFTNSEPGLLGNIYYGSEGFYGGNGPQFGYGGKAYGGKDEPEIDPNVVGGKGEADHFANFINAMRSRKIEDLNCDIEQGHLSAVLFHMANVSYRLGGRTLTFDPKSETFTGDGAKEANVYLTREYRKPFVIAETV
jgi:predicted dehydrogenase